MEFSKTSAIRFLEQHGVSFLPHEYKYEERGGTAVAARELGVDEHSVIKTLVMQTDTKSPLIVLMHGDCEVSTKQLARIIGTKSVTPCDPAQALRLSGYQVGGTSPFGTKTQFDYYIEASIFTLPRIFINGGKRGFLLEVSPSVLRLLSDVQEVSVAVRQ